MDNVGEWIKAGAVAVGVEVLLAGAKTGIMMLLLKMGNLLKN